MGISYSTPDATDPDCVITMTDDVNPERTATAGPGLTLAEQSAAIEAFFAPADD